MGEHEVQCRIVVGADGRRSRVRKALGLELERAPVLSHIAGLLVDGLVDVEEEHDIIAGEGDLFMAAFHQGGGRARVVPVPRREPTPTGSWARATSRSSSPNARSNACRSGRSSPQAGRPVRSPRIPATTPGSTAPTATARC